MLMAGCYVGAYLAAFGISFYLQMVLSFFFLVKSASWHADSVLPSAYSFSFCWYCPSYSFILFLSQSVTYQLACFLLLLRVARCFHLGGYGSLGFTAALLRTPISFDLCNSSFVFTSLCLCVVWFWWFVIVVLRKAHIVIFEVQYPVACFPQPHFTEVQFMYVPYLPLSS